MGGKGGRGVYLEEIILREREIMMKRERASHECCLLRPSSFLRVGQVL
jgi:hypothetical protein